MVIVYQSKKLPKKRIISLEKDVLLKYHLSIIEIIKPKKETSNRENREREILRMHYLRNLVPDEFNETDEKQIYQKPKEYIVEFILFNYHNVQASHIFRTYA